MLKKVRTVLILVVITLLLCNSGLSFGVQQVIAAYDEGEQSSSLEQTEPPEIDLDETDIPQLKKGHPKLDSHLWQLIEAEKRGEAESLAQSWGRGKDVVDGKVIVEIECFSPGQVEAAADAATKAGAKVVGSYKYLLGAWVPITSLETLANEESIRFIELAIRSEQEITSQGVELINANKWHTSYNGTGVKVAIVDAGFKGYSDLLGTELPPAESVTTKSFRSPEDIEADDDHGTACAEIVYDVAPGAEFYLANYELRLQFGEAIDWFIDQEVDVISSSVVFPAYGSGNGSGGIIHDAVDDASAAGILWSQAVGNWATHHWQGDFYSPDEDSVHNFTETTETNPISITDGEEIRVYLTWNDDWDYSGNNYNMCLIDPDYQLVALSIREQNGDDHPFESMFHAAEKTGDYHIIIWGQDNPEVVNFHLYSKPADLYYQVLSSSFVVPAGSTSVLAVGAVDHSIYYDTSPAIEEFSSRGPTANGTTKPDLVAPDGVTTDTKTPFYGTSAAAPHAAGAAVLVKERYPLYTPADIRNFLKDHAFDVPPEGEDNTFGWGRLYLPYMKAETSLDQAEDDADDVVVVPVSIDRVKDEFTDETIEGVSIGSYTANASYLYEFNYEGENHIDGIKMLHVRDGDSPFDNTENITHNDPSSGDDWTAFFQDPQGGTEPPLTVANLVVRLVGCCLCSYNLTVNFDSIKATTGEDIEQASSVVKTYQRGDAEDDDDIDVVDLLALKQYLVGQLELDDINAVNAASPNHDGTDGDVISIADALAIEQYLVGYLDKYFEPTRKQGGTYSIIPDSTVSIRVDEVEAEPGSRLLVPIVAEGIPKDSAGLGAYDLKLTFNPEVIRLNDIKNGDSRFDKIVYNIDNVKGIALFNNTSTEIPGATGNVVLAYLDITVTGKSKQSTTLDISVITLCDTMLKEIQAKDIDGKVVVK
ncbi:hypothetical protein ES703_67139 [subsurface metagenome]